MKKYLLQLLLLFIGVSGHSQTLYVPSGTGGIGSSSNGNVGIGVGSPISKLDVNGDIQIRNASLPMGLMTELAGTFTPILNFDLNFRETNKNNTYRGGALRLDSRDGFPFFQWLGRSAGSTTENTLMSLTEDGKLGIGIFAPLAKVHINSAVERETFRIYKQGNTTNYLNIWQGTGAGAIDPIGTGQLYLGYDQSTNVFMGITGAAVNTGSVGIGTTTPTSKLDVRGGIVARYPTGNQISIQSNTGRWDFDVDEGSGNNFRLRNMTSATVPFTVTTSGNVGIGTTNPNQKLTVNGTIYGKEVKVDLSVPGPDYVFADNYQLPTLNELKTYIDLHKHLPEVPSAAAMEVNGINLGEMNMILLKKIEELTLYQIETQKKIESLLSRIRELETKTEQK